MLNILVIEDDSILNSILSLNLEQCGYKVISADSAKNAIEKLNTSLFDFVLLDINLPDGSGLNLCQTIKRSLQPKTAVVFLSSNDLEDDILKGYNKGADDYITKPFSIPVLLKKINAIAVRTGKKEAERKYEDEYLSLDYKAMNAYINQNYAEFTPLEFEMLELLTSNAGHILTRQKIMDNIWDSKGNYVDESSLNSIICRIRGKIDSSEHQYIKTVYGIGYMWISGNRHEV